MSLIELKTQAWRLANELDELAGGIQAVAWEEKAQVNHIVADTLMALENAQEALARIAVVEVSSEAVDALYGHSYA